MYPNNLEPTKACPQLVGEDKYLFSNLFKRNIFLYQGLRCNALSLLCYPIYY